MRTDTKNWPEGHIIFLDGAFNMLLKKNSGRVDHCRFALEFQLKEWQWREKFKIHGACPCCEGTGEYVKENR